MRGYYIMLVLRGILGAFLRACIRDYDTIAYVGSGELAIRSEDLELKRSKGH